MNPQGKTVYLKRSGVNIRCQGQGFGALALEKAMKTARTQGVNACACLWQTAISRPFISMKKTGLLGHRATMTKYSRTIALLYANTAMKWRFRNFPVRLAPKKVAFFLIPVLGYFSHSKHKRTSLSGCPLMFYYYFITCCTFPASHSGYEAAHAPYGYWAFPGIRHTASLPAHSHGSSAWPCLRPRHRAP